MGSKRKEPFSLNAQRASLQHFHSQERTGRNSTSSPVLSAKEIPSFELRGGAGPTIKRPDASRPKPHSSPNPSPSNRSRLGNGKEFPGREGKTVHLTPEQHLLILKIVDESPPTERPALWTRLTGILGKAPHRVLNLPNQYPIHQCVRVYMEIMRSNHSHEEHPCIFM